MYEKGMILRRKHVKSGKFVSVWDVAPHEKRYGGRTILTCYRLRIKGLNKGVSYGQPTFLFTKDDGETPSGFELTGMTRDNLR